MNAAEPLRLAVLIRSIAIVTTITAAAGWLAAGTPFQGDQALYLQGAQHLANGDVLYRDFWDVTNPGIFVFYAVGGSCFGMTEDGIHLFEWFWWMAFVAVVSEVIRREYRMTAWPIAPAILIAVLYFGPSCSDETQLTKTEGLVAFPTFVAVGAASRGTARGWCVAGIAGGIVLAFKWILIAGVLMGWAVLLIDRIRGASRGEFLRMVAAGLIGFSIVPLLLIAYAIRHDSWSVTWQTLFVDPRLMLAEGQPAPTERLIHLVRWGLEQFTATAAIAFLGTVTILRQRFHSFVTAYAVTAVSGVGLILIQRWSWWNYHALLVGMPISVLAAFTLPAITRHHFATASRWDRVLLAMAGLILLLPAFGHGVAAARPLIGHRFGITADDRKAARMSASAVYRHQFEIAERFSSLEMPPGAIYVFGDPLILMATGRRQAVPIHGWSFELYHAGTRSLFERQLRDAKPIAVFVDSQRLGIDQLLAERSPAILSWLADEYDVVDSHHEGIWYRRRTP